MFPPKHVIAGINDDNTVIMPSNWGVPHLQTILTVAHHASPGIAHYLDTAMDDDFDVQLMKQLPGGPRWPWKSRKANFQRRI